MADVKFYRCERCGQIVVTIKSTPVTPACCDAPMTLLEAGSVDAAQEKHVPAIAVVEGGIEVNVGEVDHPMTEEHLIEWVALVTDTRVDVHTLTAADAPKTAFAGEFANADVYAYCNLHGLWKASV